MGGGLVPPGEGPERLGLDGAQSLQGPARWLLTGPLCHTPHQKVIFGGLAWMAGKVPLFCGPGLQTGLSGSARLGWVKGEP